MHLSQFNLDSSATQFDLAAIHTTLRASKEETATTHAEAADVHARAAGLFAMALGPVLHMFCVTAESLIACAPGLEEEVATSHLEADDLRRHLNDLEDCHKALSRAVLDAVRVT